MRPAEPCTVTALEYVISSDGDDFTVAKVMRLLMECWQLAALHSRQCVNACKLMHSHKLLLPPFAIQQSWCSQVLRWFPQVALPAYHR